MNTSSYAKKVFSILVHLKVTINNYLKTKMKIASIYPILKSKSERKLKHTYFVSPVSVSSYHSNTICIANSIIKIHQHLKVYVIDCEKFLLKL